MKYLALRKKILYQIHKTEIKGLDNSAIDSNPWLAGFTDADGNFSINIHKRTNRNSIRVQLFLQTDWKLDKLITY